MTPLVLKQRVEARDRLVRQAENVEAQMQDQVFTALARGDLHEARAAAGRNENQLRELTENLRIYQAELHAQADELAAAQERSEQVLARFAALFATMPVAALQVGFNGELLEFNAKATRLFGLRQRGPVVRFLHRMVDEATYQQRVRPAFHEARDSGASALDGVAFIGEDGRRFIGELHIARLPGNQPSLQTRQTAAPGASVPLHGQVEQFTCAVIDRTEHLEDLQALQTSAQALRQSEAFLADSARLARTGGWELQLQPKQMRWSRELHELLEIEPGESGPSLEPSLSALLERCRPHDRALLAAAVLAAEQGQAFEIELDMCSRSGRPLRMLAAGHASRTDGEIDRVSGVFQDISLQAQARQQIDDLTERLSLANDAGGIGIWDWNLDSGELVFDERLQQLLGLAPDALPPRADLADALSAHLAPEDMPLLTTAIARALDQREPLNQELRRKPSDPDADASTPAGNARNWLHITGRAHFDAQGQARRLVGCAWDSSSEHEAARLRAAKESAESASRAKSAFLSRMSHELRTPLNAILGFSQLMRMEAEAGDLVLKPHRVTLIETAARHLLDLVNEVLDVSRIESGQLEVKLSSFDLQGVVAEVLPLLQGLAAQNGVSLHDHVAAQPAVIVLADRLRLKEVLINLVSNAVKYNQAGGRVDVLADPPDSAGATRISVTDTGRGLDPQQMAGLFQPFNRLGAEASGIEGTGMGLFVSRRFMELMGGSIDVSSQPGQGTQVQLTLNAPA